MGVAGAMARVGGLLAPSAIAFITSAAFELAIGLFVALLLFAALAVSQIDISRRVGRSANPTRRQSRAQKSSMARSLSLRWGFPDTVLPRRSS